MNNKTLNIFLIIIFIFIQLIAPVYSFQNEPDGFRALIWGDPPSKISTLQKSETHKGYDVYINTRDKLEIKGVELTEIGYIFKNNAFIKVTLMATNPKMMLSVLKEEFGDSVNLTPAKTKYNNPSPEYVWTGNKTIIKYQVVNNHAFVDLISAKSERESETSEGTGF